MVAIIVGISVLVVGGAALGWTLWGGGDKDDSAEDPKIFTVKRGPITISVTERGTIQNRDKIIVKNRVHGQSSIGMIVDEGKQVTKGELLMELNSSDLIERKDRQEIVVTNAEASFIGARENYAVVQNQAESNIARAKLDQRLAKLDHRKYVEGDYPQQIKQAQSQITIAKEEYERAMDRRKWSEGLAAEGYLTSTELKADRLAETRTKLDWELATDKLDVLKKFTHERALAELDSNVIETKKALERAQRKAAADVLQAKANFHARESEYKRQQDQLKDLAEQITFCKVYSPVDGLVVYATSARRSRWGGGEPLAEGQQVRDRQDLFHIPTAAAMMAEIKIHEASLEKVRPDGEIRPDMEVRVTINAMPDKVFFGTLAKIAPLPDAASWWANPDLKVFNAEVHLDGENPELRPGMSCSAMIVVKEHADVIAVPMEAVQRINGHSTVTVVGPKGKEQRKVKLGLDNNRIVIVDEGLAEGERIDRLPPLAAAEAGHGTSAAAKGARRRRPPAAKAAAKPTTKPAGQESQRKKPTPQELRKKMENLTPEQRRKLMQNLTPEQQKAMAKMKRSGGGGERGAPGRGRRGDGGAR